MAEFSTISTQDLNSKLESDDHFLLVDTLGDESYNRAHIPGAVSISAKEDGFVERVKEAVDDMAVEVIVYCGSHSCGLSPQAAADLVEAGFMNVVDYEGGLKSWAEAGYDLEGEEADTVAKNLAES
jgi:rhodanese-related sulfurtransferase